MQSSDTSSGRGIQIEGTYCTWNMQPTERSREYKWTKKHYIFNNFFISSRRAVAYYHTIHVLRSLHSDAG